MILVILLNPVAYWKNTGNSKVENIGENISY